MHNKRQKRLLAIVSMDKCMNNVMCGLAYSALVVYVSLTTESGDPLQLHHLLGYKYILTLKAAGI